MRDNHPQSPPEKENPQQCCTLSAPISAGELKSLRLKMGRNQTEMAAELSTPRRTYQDWELGHTRIPGTCAVAMRLLVERDGWVTRFSVETATAQYEERKARVLDRLLRRQ